MGNFHQFYTSMTDFLESIHDLQVTLLFDETGRIQTDHQSMIGVLGYVPSQIAEMHVQELLGIEHLEEWLNEQLSAKRYVMNEVYTLNHQQLGPVQRICSLFRVQSAKSLYVLHIQDNYAFDELEKRYVEKCIELDTFIYRASHDLRGPVSTITGLAHILRLDASDHQTTTHAESIVTTCEKLNNILSNLLQVVEIKSGIVTQPVPIEMNRLLFQVLEKVSHSFNIFDVFFKIQVEQPTRFYSHENLLFSSLYNLLINSVLYRKQNVQAVIEVNISQTSDQLMHIVIKDNGLGIPKEVQHKVFKMFFRGNELSKGNGLGLYLVKNHIDFMKGNIGFQSDAEGTTIHIKLPSL